MKSISFLLILFFCLIGLFSCDIGRKEKAAEQKQETPKSLQNNVLEIKTSRSSNDLVESLYEELIDKNPDLKKLEADIFNYIPKPEELRKKFNNYDNKSRYYYRSADHKVASITDSLLKIRIKTLLEKSIAGYSAKSSELNLLMEQISLKEASLNDFHAVLKIVLTLPLIEKYQNDYLPGKKEFNDMIKLQDTLINKTKRLTPKY